MCVTVTRAHPRARTLPRAHTGTCARMDDRFAAARCASSRRKKCSGRTTAFCAFGCAFPWPPFAAAHAVPRSTFRFFAQRAHPLVCSLECCNIIRGLLVSISNTIAPGQRWSSPLLQKNRRVWDGADHAQRNASARVRAHIVSSPIKKIKKTPELEKKQEAGPAKNRSIFGGKCPHFGACRFRRCQHENKAEL